MIVKEEVKVDFPKKILLSDLYKGLNPYMKKGKVDLCCARKYIREKKFDKKTLCDLLYACRWFDVNYSNWYTADICDTQYGVQMFVQDHHGEIFIKYESDNGQMYTYKGDKFHHIEYLKKIGGYDEQINYIVDVPVR